jgi:hypothetical protein
VDADGARVEARIEDLRELRRRFEIRADSLPADLALAGLVDDVLATSVAAISLPSDATSVMYPLVRIAFEDAQRIVALGTDDDYIRVGTRAWLYYQRKDALICEAVDGQRAELQLKAAVAQMEQAWSKHNEKAATFLRSEDAWLNQHKGPDNFLKANLAAVVQGRRDRIFDGSRPFPEEIAALDRGIYAALSRESHAGLRMQPVALAVSFDGVVDVIPHPSDEAARRRTLLNCLELSLSEATGALSFLLRSRERDEAARLKATTANVSETLRPGFRPDLGLYLARAGATTCLRFPGVPVYKLGVFPDGTARWSANVVVDDREFIGTFEVPATMLGELAAALAIPASALQPACTLARHVLDGPPRITVDCILGQVQQNAAETFVPLVATCVAGEGCRSR